MEDDDGADRGGDEMIERPIARGLAQGHGAAPWMFLQPPRWRMLEDRLGSLEDAGLEEIAHDLIRVSTVRLRQQAGQLGYQAAVDRYFTEDGTEGRDDRWIVRTGLYAELIEVAFEIHQNEAETLSSILERIRRERERRNRDIGEERTRGNDGHQPPPPPQPPPWPPPPHNLHHIHIARTETHRSANGSRKGRHHDSL